MIGIKRVYDPRAEIDGFRILIDRLWPRGIRKEEAQVDLWLKDIAPSTGLRQWFGHEPEKWPEFQQRYFRELDAKKRLIDLIREKSARGNVTLLYGARNEKFNNAVSLREYIETKG
jgi:uncharacterized protein YeaO (DUF488 family)